MKKVDPLKHLPDDNQVHLFLSSLKENIAIFTAMHNLTFLEDAINTAEEVAAILNELKPIVIDLKEGTKIIIAEDVITRIEKEVPIEFNEDNITIQPILKKHITKHQPSIQKLAIILRRPMAPVESNLVEAVMTIAAKCYIWIKDNSIRFGVAVKGEDKLTELSPDRGNHNDVRSFSEDGETNAYDLRTDKGHVKY
ncbi:hypothetical protein C2G38_2193125 [Gigaspora rosea]|uniref:Uncharacterized protein n=1 Tax=Gigaspora rosea TaxID=44941 RepID=A0A397V5E1_9GLOM|nr:hypothetical protein C2G38_2193125 [Gigaspora rosea]